MPEDSIIGQIGKLYRRSRAIDLGKFSSAIWPIISKAVISRIIVAI
jgi:hypothetical protein